MQRKKEKRIVPEKKEPNPAAVMLGRIGGQKTALRGPGYYRKIAAQRKKFSGGRPRKA